MPLAIRVQFLAGYSGREWPPSPARLFKALVASARSGWAQSNRKAIDDSLRVLEQQGRIENTKLPEIVTPHAKQRPARQRRFIPNNSKNWPSERKFNPVKGIDLDEEPLAGWEVGWDGKAERHVADIEMPHTVWYWWPDVDASHVPIIRDVARRVPSVGKGEDLAILDATDAKPPDGAVRWQPASTGASLEVPEAGCLDVCDALFARDRNELPLSAAGVRAVTYASDTRAADRDVPTFVLGLWRNGKRCSWDARLLRQVVGPVRHLLDEVRAEVVDMLARGPSDRPAMEALVRRVLVGHDESDKPVSEPHLAVLPLPSVLGPYPDGRVRRIALADFGGGDDPTRRAIVEMAQVLLHGRELRDNGRGTGVILDTEPDGQWLRAITKRSRTWVTVTPLVQQAKELTRDEWKRLIEARRNVKNEPAKAAARELHLQKRRRELVERSVRQAIAGREASIESIEVVAGGPLAGVHIAKHYRANGYLGETPKLHVRVTFDRPVAGPIAIGRGRHVGFGVLWPVDAMAVHVGVAS
ncbi:type I-G CRISPR-associated protein Csb2 [Sinimarinibacterium thermocellulolyticum]|uniref:Type I-U CRISPR-associated protein Csb2 n=1 Tax=Sinimarinibacterium thermocellulolyticum TaxID=3170016 RepID=A0ABV2ADE8_9GAMM